MVTGNCCKYIEHTDANSNTIGNGLDTYREKNQQADYLSRSVDHDDWMVNPYIFQWIDSIWGPHIIDKIATHYN